MLEIRHYIFLIFVIVCGFAMSFAVLLGPLLDQYESPWRAFFVLLNSGVCVRRSPSSPRALGFAFLEPLFWFRGGEGRGPPCPARI